MRHRESSLNSTVSGCIYLLRNLTNGKGYVGQHSSMKPDNRWREHIRAATVANSSCVLHRAIRKYGVEHFSAEIIWSGPISKLHEKEAFYIAKLGTLLPLGYNMTLGGEGTRGFKHSEASKCKSRASNKKTYADPLLRARQAAIWSGRKHTEATKLKVRRGMLNFFAENPDHRRYMSEINKGKKLTLEARKKISIANAGRTVSEIHRKKLALAQTGKTYTEASRLRMSEVHTGVPWSAKRREVYSEKKLQQLDEKICQLHGLAV